MEIRIATGSLVFFHLTSSHEEIHDCPMELLWKEGTKRFWQPLAEVYGSTKTNTPKYKNQTQHQITNQASAHTTNIPGSLSVGLR